MLMNWETDLGTRATKGEIQNCGAMADTELEERLRDAETRARDAEAMMIQVLGEGVSDLKTQWWKQQCLLIIVAKVPSVRLHSKSHQTNSKCQNLLTGWHLEILGGDQLKKLTVVLC